MSLLKPKADLLDQTFEILSHGVVKIVLVFALLRTQLWAYPWMIALLGIFILLRPSAGLIRRFGRASSAATELT